VKHLNERRTTRRALNYLVVVLLPLLIHLANILTIEQAGGKANQNNIL
jgi:hypothetical protein